MSEYSKGKCNYCGAHFYEDDYCMNCGKFRYQSVDSFDAEMAEHEQRMKVVRAEEEAD